MFSVSSSIKDILSFRYSKSSSGKWAGAASTSISAAVALRWVRASVDLSWILTLSLSSFMELTTPPEDSEPPSTTLTLEGIWMPMPCPACLPSGTTWMSVISIL